MNAMIVGKYRVECQPRGWTWARPAIYVRARLFGFLWWRWKQVWDCPGFAIPITRAQTMLPKEMRGWFEGAVTAYEAYAAAWATPPTEEASNG
jgi:hypothetical protein